MNHKRILAFDLIGNQTGEHERRIRQQQDHECLATMKKKKLNEKRYEKYVRTGDTYVKYFALWKFHTSGHHVTNIPMHYDAHYPNKLWFEKKNLLFFCPTLKMQFFLVEMCIPSL